MWNRRRVLVQPSRLYRVWGGVLPRLLVRARIHHLLCGLRRDVAGGALGPARHLRAGAGLNPMSTCECGLLHPEARRAQGCRECNVPCCPSCAIEIDSDTFCRWCALAMAPALSL